MENKNLHPTGSSSFSPEEPEQLDALDELIINELGQQQRLRAMMQRWELRQRRARRLRLLPIVSNILSVAALMILGFVLQALVPGLHATTTTVADDVIIHDPTLPSDPQNPVAPLPVPADSAFAE